MSGTQSAEPDNTAENDLIIEKSDEDYAETDVSRHSLFYVGNYVVDADGRDF